MAKIRITGHTGEIAGTSRLVSGLTVGRVYDVLCWDDKGLGIPRVRDDIGVSRWLVNTIWERVEECEQDSLTQRIAALEKRVDRFTGKPCF